MMGDKSRPSARSVKDHVTENACRIVHVKARCSRDVHAVEVQRTVWPASKCCSALARGELQVDQAQVAVDVLEMQRCPVSVMGARVQAVH